jgi:hypothetical protein
MLASNKEKREELRTMHARNKAFEERLAGKHFKLHVSPHEKKEQVCNSMPESQGHETCVFYPCDHPYFIALTCSQDALLASAMGHERKNKLREKKKRLARAAKALAEAKAMGKKGIIPSKLASGKTPSWFQANAKTVWLHLLETKKAEAQEALAKEAEADSLQTLGLKPLQKKEVDNSKMASAAKSDVEPHGEPAAWDFKALSATPAVVQKKGTLKGGMTSTTKGDVEQHGEPAAWDFKALSGFSTQSEHHSIDAPYTAHRTKASTGSALPSHPLIPPSFSPMQVLALLRKQGADQERKWTGSTPTDVMAPSIPGEERGEGGGDTPRPLLSHDTGF